MKPATALIGIVAVLLIVFTGINWAMLTTPIQASFGFARVNVALGALLLGLVVLVSAIFTALLLSLQLRVLTLHRRHAAELGVQRQLAESAETSRVAELRQFLQQELAALKEAQQASEQRLRQELIATGNSLAASVGQVDERLERQWPSAPEHSA